MAEEKGIVNKYLEAVLQINLTNGASIDCLLDTGFNGNLILPKYFIEKHCPATFIRVQV